MEDALEPGVMNPGAERRNLQALGIGCIVFVLIGFFGLKILAAVMFRVVKWLL